MKKIIGLVLVLTMVIGCCGGIVFAEETTEKLVLSVKQRLKIPTEYAELTTEKYSNQSGETLYLQWRDMEKKTFISGEVTDKGIITSYYNSSVKNDRGISRLTPKQAIEIAKAWLKKVNPIIADEYIFDIENIRMGYGIILTAQRYTGEAKIESDGVTVRLNSQTGEVSDMNLTYTDYSFTLPENIISAEVAKAKFGENTKLILAYLKSGERAIPVYIDYEAGYIPRFGIDAVTGEKTEIERNYFRVFATGDAMNKNEAFDTAEDELSEQEIAELSNYESYISPSDAVKNLKAISEFNISEYNLERYSYTKRLTAKEENNSDDVALGIILRNENGYARGELDAKTGEILSFFSNPNNENRVEKINSAKADEIAYSLIKRLCGEKSVVKSAQMDNGEGFTQETVYLQTINGLPFINSKVTVTVDKTTGFVTNYVAEFEKEDISFEKADNVLVPTEAENKYLGEAEYELIFADISSDIEPYKYILVYNRVNPPYCIDAMQGNRLTQSGEEEKEPLTSYIDLEGHWAKNIIDALVANGYLDITEEKFRPNDNITFGEAEKMLNSAGFYKHLGNIQEDEAMTRETAVKLMICGAGYEKAGALSGIYAPTFKDWLDISPENQGYVALAKGFKIINGDQNGNFNPKANMTRSAFAVMVYNFINSGQLD